MYNMMHSSPEPLLIMLLTIALKLSDLVYCIGHAATCDSLSITSESADNVYNNGPEKKGEKGIQICSPENG